MYRMNDSWTDGRLDDFAKHVDQRFDAVDQRFDAVERQTKERFNAVERQTKERFDRVDADLREMVKRFDGLQRTLFLGNMAIVAALIGIIATQL